MNVKQMNEQISKTYEKITSITKRRLKRFKRGAFYFTDCGKLILLPSIVRRFL